MTDSLFPDAEPPFVCMAFCAETGNAVGSFDCTPDELRRVSAEWFTHATIEPSPLLAVPWVQEELRG